MDQQLADVQQEQFSTLFETECDYTRPRRGQIRQAVVLSVDENDVIVDLGCKRDGIVPRKDLEMLDEVYRAGLQVGDHVPVCVLTPASRQGELVVSLKQGLVQQDWLRAEEYMENGTVCEAEVMEVNRGGVIVSFGRLQGFVPNSLADASAARYAWRTPTSGKVGFGGANPVAGSHRSRQAATPPRTVTARRRLAQAPAVAQRNGGG